MNRVGHIILTVLLERKEKIVALKEKTIGKRIFKKITKAIRFIFLKIKLGERSLRKQDKIFLRINQSNPTL